MISLPEKYTTADGRSSFRLIYQQFPYLSGPARFCLSVRACSISRSIRPLRSIRGRKRQLQLRERILLNHPVHLGRQVSHTHHRRPQRRISRHARSALFPHNRSRQTRFVGRCRIFRQRDQSKTLTTLRYLKSILTARQTFFSG